MAPRELDRQATPSPLKVARQALPLRVWALRVLPGGQPVAEAALAQAGCSAWPKPGQYLGTDPCLAWRTPREAVLLSSSGDASAALAQALAPGIHELAYAVEQTDGTVVFELQADQAQPLLSRLVDAQAMPAARGCASRTRLGDVAVLLLWRSDGSMWLAADAAHRPYLEAWLEHAAQGLATAA